MANPAPATPMIPRAGSNAAQIERIRAYQGQGANMIMFCDPFGLPELHRLIVEEVRLDTTTDKYNNGPDIFTPKGAKGFALHLAPLERLAVAAGAGWVPEKTRVITSTPTYLMCEATVFVKKEYGQVVAWMGQAEFDLDFLRDDLVDQYRGRENAEYCVNRDFRARRKQRLKLCMSDAKAVALRKLFGLGGCHSIDTLKKPFVIVRCVVAPDYSDPETVKLLRAASIQSVAGAIFGPQAAGFLPAPVENSDTVDIGESSMADVDPYDNPPPPVDPQNPDPYDLPPADAPVPPEFVPPTTAAAFASLGRRQKQLAIEIVAARKGVSLPGVLEKPLDEYSDKALNGFYPKLLAKPDTTTDDIPL
mgnify:CR=1 FL=1